MEITIIILGGIIVFGYYYFTEFKKKKELSDRLSSSVVNFNRGKKWLAMMQ